MTSFIQEFAEYLKDTYDPKGSLLIFDEATRLFFSKAPPLLPPSALPPPIKASPPPKPKIEKPLPPPPVEEEKIVLEKPISEEPFEVEEYRKIYAKIAPKMKLEEAPPKDSVAKSIHLMAKTRNKLPKIPIFVSEAAKEFLPFLDNLAKAITASFDEAKLFSIDPYEKENLYGEIAKAKEEIFLILVPDVVLATAPNLRTYYRLFPGKVLKRIGNVDTFLLSDLGQYLKTPELKKNLWTTLLETLNKKRKI